MHGGEKEQEEGAPSSNHDRFVICGDVEREKEKRLHQFGRIEKGRSRITLDVIRTAAAPGTGRGCMCRGLALMPACCCCCIRSSASCCMQANGGVIWAPSSISPPHPPLAPSSFPLPLSLSLSLLTLCFVHRNTDAAASAFA